MVSVVVLKTIAQMYVTVMFQKDEELQLPLLCLGDKTTTVNISLK